MIGIYLFHSVCKSRVFSFSKSRDWIWRLLCISKDTRSHFLAVKVSLLVAFLSVLMFWKHGQSVLKIWPANNNLHTQNLIVPQELWFVWKVPLSWILWRFSHLKLLSVRLSGFAFKIFIQLINFDTDILDTSLHAEWNIWSQNLMVRALAQKLWANVSWVVSSIVLRVEKSYPKFRFDWTDLRFSARALEAQIYSRVHSRKIVLNK